jgi:hypothetical protein
MGSVLLAETMASVVKLAMHTEMMKHAVTHVMRVLEDARVLRMLSAVVVVPVRLRHVRCAVVVVAAAPEEMMAPRALTTIALVGEVEAMEASAVAAVAMAAVRETVARAATAAGTLTDMEIAAAQAMRMDRALMASEVDRLGDMATTFAVASFLRLLRRWWPACGRSSSPSRCKGGSRRYGQLCREQTQQLLRSWG